MPSQRPIAPFLLLPLLGLALPACGGRGASPDATPSVPHPAPYHACSESEPCAAGSECVAGLCISRCGGGPACVEGSVCGEGSSCTDTCDDAHPCDQAWSCVDGTCTDDPCGHPEFWPLSLRSESLPIIVHYRDPAEESEARRTLEYSEHSWRVETEQLGFQAPLSDGGACGPDGAFDVFVWRTYRGGVGDVIAENPDTPWDDYTAYLIMDPWGPYGGDILAATVAHELNHAMQAVHDWNETPIAFEMTSQFIEDLVYDDDNNWRSLLADFQQHPDWSLDYNDDYETWYFYGAALYLHYLRDGVLSGSVDFVDEMWRCSHNPAGDNEPDFEDALESILRERAGIGFHDSVLGFARWRWFTGERDDGRHFEEGASLPPEAAVRIAHRFPASAGEHELEAPMMLGTVYATVAAPAPGTSLVIRIEGDPSARWAVQAVPGLDPGFDGELLDAAEYGTVLAFGGLAERTLVITAMPPDPALDDPDGRSDQRYPVTLWIEEASADGE